MTDSTQKLEMIRDLLEVQRRLVAETDVREEVPAALRTAGRAAQVDRVYIFQITDEDQREIYASQRFEWAADSVSPEIDNPDLQDLPLRAAGYGRWLRAFADYQPIFGEVANFPTEERPMLESQGILSILVLPVFTRGRLWGFVGFDDCHETRVWNEAEVDILISLAFSLGMALSGPDPTEVDAATAEAFGVLGRLLQVQYVAFSDTPMESLLTRTQARFRALVEAHRYLSRAGVADRIALRELFGILHPVLKTLWERRIEEPPWEIELQADETSLDIARALDLLVILTEVFWVVARDRTEGAVASRLALSVHNDGAHGELVLTARDHHGVPAAAGASLDGAAHVLVRRLTEQLRARLIPSKTEGLVFRISFPLQ